MATIAQHRQTAIEDHDAIAELLARLDAGATLTAGSEEFQLMSLVSGHAARICAYINTGWHEPEDMHTLLEELTARPVPDNVRIMPTFHADFGRNITFGSAVFINSGCKFQDQGGIVVGDGTQVGHNVVIATLNHPLDPARRHDIMPQPVHIGKNVWIGSNATVLPGVTIGDNAVIGAGAVVRNNVAAGTVVAGVPARLIKTIESDSMSSGGAAA